MNGVGGVGGTRGSSGKAGIMAGSGVTVAVEALVAIGVGAAAEEATIVPPTADVVVAVSELTSLAKRGIFAGDAVGVGRSDFVVSFL